MTMTGKILFPRANHNKPTRGSMGPTFSFPNNACRKEACTAWPKPHGWNCPVESSPCYVPIKLVIGMVFFGRKPGVFFFRLTWLTFNWEPFSISVFWCGSLISVAVNSHLLVPPQCLNAQKRLLHRHVKPWGYHWFSQRLGKLSTSTSGNLHANTTLWPGVGGGSWQSKKKQQESWSISGIALLTSSDLTHDGQMNVIVWVQHESSHAEGKRTWLRGQNMLQFRPRLQINLWRDGMWHSQLRTFHLPSMTQFTMCSVQ